MNFRPNENFKYYMYFIEERMNIFWRKYFQIQNPYTDDKILQEYKFTNVYRSLDRVSQYLIREIINEEEGYTKKDLFWRILLFKHFNKIETWEHLIADLGDITFDTTKEEIIESLDKLSQNDIPVYSNAFMLTASFMRKPDFMAEYGLEKGSKKYVIYLSIFYKYFIGLGKIDEVLNSSSLKNLYDNLRKTPAFANFLAMQFTTDLNWSFLFNFDENDFVVASVGSTRGINRCFTFEGRERNYDEVIMWIHANFDKLLKEYDCNFIPLPNRMPTVMDLQNCLCETDKYLRGLGVEIEGVKVHGKRIKSKYKESSKKITQYYFPKDWNVGELKI